MISFLKIIIKPVLILLKIDTFLKYPINLYLPQIFRYVSKDNLDEQNEFQSFYCNLIYTILNKRVYYFCKISINKALFDTR